MENTQVVAKTTIRPNIANMVKTPGGSFHKDDFIGNALAGLSLSQVQQVAVAVGLDPSKYSHLNNGQQRMTLGNQLRKKAGVPDANGDLTTETSEARNIITNMAGEFREINLIAKQEEEAAKEAIKAEKAAAAAAKPKKAKKAKDEAAAE